MEMLSPRPAFQKPSPVPEVSTGTPDMPNRNSIRLNRDRNNLLQLYEILLENSFGEKYIKCKYKEKREEMVNKTLTGHVEKETQQRPKEQKIYAPRAVKVTNYFDDRFRYYTTYAPSPQFYHFQQMEIFHHGHPYTEAPTDLSLPRKENFDQNPHLLRCPICKRSTFYKKEYLDAHLMLHRNKTCDHCRKEFSTLSDLIRHKNESYCITKNQIPSNPVNVTLMKEDEPVPVVAAVERHTFRHKPKLSNEKLFKCPSCVKQFKYEKSYRTHLLTHTLMGRYECAHCNHKYRHKPNLIKHLKKCHGLC